MVTSTPRARAPRINSSADVADSPALLFMCTMCTEAPVAAAFAITSWNGAIAPPARKAPDERR